MDNFLTLLYFELFKLTNREKQLMSNTWPDDEKGHNSCIRNDQSIAEVRQTSKLLRELITEYLDHKNRQA